MSRFVIDPPTAVKWFVPEENSGRCSRLLDGGHELLTADTLFAEAGRIVNSKVRNADITLKEAQEVITALKQMPVTAFRSEPLLESALDVAATLDISLNDSLCICVAVQHDCRLVTAKRDLYESMQGTPFSMHVKWVGDLR